MKRRQQIVISGAGLVGSLLATLLTQRGYRVTVLEKRPDLRRHAISAGRSINLALAERGIHGLRLAGLFDEVARQLIPMRGRMIHEHDGSLEFLSYGQRPHEVIYSVSRGGLNAILLDALEQDPESKLEFQSEVVDVDFQRRTVEVQDQVRDFRRTLAFDYYIAADGGGSLGRRLITTRLGGEDRSELLDHDYKELHLAPGPTGQFQIEREALHIWPRGGFMLIALPNLDGSFTVTLFLPKRGERSFEQLQTPPAVHQFFREFFPDATALIPDLVEAFFRNPTGELGTVRCWPWVVPGCAMLIGDAAHAIVPFHGQGMNAGFEDCAEFIRLLDAAGHDWERTMLEFQRQRKPNADAIAEMALENYVIMRDSVRDPQFAVKKELGFELERRFPDRFIPRYSMVMFHRIPYQEALTRGRIQEEILSELAHGLEDPQGVDLNRAHELVASRLSTLDPAYLA